MRGTRLLSGAVTCAILAFAVAWPQARQPQEQGWAVRASLSNPNGKLYNNAKQKLLDGKQIYGFTISKLDVDLYCEAAKHWDFIWFEMQHSTMSYQDVEKMLVACPRPAATPILRVPDALEGTIQKATDLGMLGIVVPTVDTVEKAVQAARYARYPPEGRRSSGTGQAASLWGVNGINYRETINDNMLVLVQLETPESAWNAYNISQVPGIDVVMGSNGDMRNFSGFAPTDPRYIEFFNHIHDAVLKAGKFLAVVTTTYSKPGPPGVGRQDYADWRMMYSGPAFDGYEPPER
jgi:2-keto-3-deoxy-L-rhamnonate aldolase RhmA